MSTRSRSTATGKRAGPSSTSSGTAPGRRRASRSGASAEPGAAPSLLHERRAWARGFRRVAGLDEAGRGPLAGPVVAAAVVIDPDFLEAEAGGDLSKVNDSKRLTPARREQLHALLAGCPAVSVGIGSASEIEIDRCNILQATCMAMRRALDGLSESPDHVLVDGRPVRSLGYDHTAIVRGDAASLLIAAASIVAKVHRDRIMLELDRAHPAYGFARNKGYGTPEHLRALNERGPASCHRRSFAPVAQMRLEL